MKFLSISLALFSAGLAVNGMPAADLNRRQDLAQVITSCTVPNTAALTFDDGPYNYVKDISKALTDAGAKGTFFFNGNNYGCIYAPEIIERVQYAFKDGHQIASHTWSHTDLTTLNYEEADAELSRLDEALIRIVGVEPAFMRPPYGKYNDVVQQVAAKRGQKIVIWDFDSGDSKGATPDESKQAYVDLANNHPSNVLALNHETYERTAHEVVPHAISTLQGQGYNLVTVAECLGVEPYQSIKTPENGSWQC